MCGIFGIIRTKGPAYGDAEREQWARLMASLATLSTSRGMDSTGFMHVAADGAIAVAKDAVPAWEFLTRPDWRAVAAPKDGTLATIGHTRLATHGAVNAANAHPFVFSNDDGDVTAAVHNGVINNHAQFAAGRKLYAVDSANLIAALAGAKVREWRGLFRRAQGSMALAIARTSGGKATVYLTRRGNPTWTAHVHELHATAFASTKEILNAALKLSRLTAGAASPTDEGTVYAWADAAPAAGWKWADKATKAKGKKGGAITTYTTQADAFAAYDAERDAERVSAALDRVAPATPGKAIGSNGNAYERCGACLDWNPPHTMVHHPDGRVLCGGCSTAATSWRKMGGEAWDKANSHAAHRSHRGGRSRSKYGKYADTKAKGVA